MLPIHDCIIPGSSTIIESLQRIERGGAQIVLIVDASNRLQGTVTDGDVRRAILKGIRLDAPVSSIMNSSPTFVDRDVSQEVAFRIMRERGIRQLPVVDSDQKVLGVLTWDVIVRDRSEETMVVMMAGGIGSRLRPLTENTPKPLLPIGGRPLLEIMIENLARQGFGRFVLSVRYKAEMFMEHFADGSRLGVKIEYVHEAEQLGTAGALRLLPARPNSPILVINADILSNFDARILMHTHKERGSPATLCVRDYEWKIPYGVVQESSDGLLTGFEEKPTRRENVSAGIYVLAPETLDLIPASGSYDMPTLLGKIGDTLAPPCIYKLHEYWLDIGRIDDLHRAREEFVGVFL